MYNIYSPAVSDTRSAFKSAECWSGISVFSLFYILYFIFIETDFRGFNGFLLETGASTGASAGYVLEIMLHHLPRHQFHHAFHHAFQHNFLHQLEQRRTTTGNTLESYPYTTCYDDCFIHLTLIFSTKTTSILTAKGGNHLINY